MNYSNQEQAPGINESYFYYLYNIKFIFDSLLGDGTRSDGMLQNDNNNASSNTNDADSIIGSMTIAC
jgi:hypothetical protein